MSGSFTVDDVADGFYTVLVVNTIPSGTALASAAFQKVSSPTITVYPNLGVPPGYGTLDGGVAVTGAAFATGSARACTLSDQGTGLFAASPVPTCSISATGTVTGTFAVSSSATVGTSHTVRVTDTNPAGVYDEIITFNVLDAPTLLAAAPASGSIGSLVSIAQGTKDFALQDVGPCTITSYPTGLASFSSCYIGSDGKIVIANFVVSSAATGGAYVVIVTGLHGDSAATLFTVGNVVTLSPTEGRTGTTVTVTGSGFNSLDTSCKIYLPFITTPDGGNIGSCTIAGGSITGSFNVPDIVPGIYQVAVYGFITSPSGIYDVGVASFQVTPGITLTPTSGRPGTTVIVMGSNFASGDTGACTISSSGGTGDLISSSTCTVAGGTMSGSFVVASGTSGSYMVIVTGSTGDAGSASFVVPPPPTITLTPPISGPVGTGVSVVGSNFLGTTCMITAVPSTLFTSQSCSIVAGALTGSFTVASGAPPGTVYTVTVQTNAGAGDSATSTFAVTAGPSGALTLSQYSGPAGTVVSGTGTGFPTDTSCVLTSGPLGLLSSPSCIVSGGTVTIGFTVPSSAAIGPYTVLAVGDTGRSASATFTVTTPALFSLSANPSSLVLSQGGTATVIVTVLSSGGFASPVTLSASLPAGVTGGFSPNPVAPPAGGTVTSTLSIGVSSTAPSTTTAITITGTAGGNTATAAMSLVIQATVVTVTTSTTSQTTRPCIIATATFGSEVSPAVQFLRGFRDNLVLKTRAGSAFMEVFNAWYYSFSPSVASFIAANDPIRAPARAVLYPLLGVLGITTLTYSLFSSSPEFAVVIAGLIASSLIGLVYLTLPALVSFNALARRRKIRITSIAKASLTLLAVALALLAVGELAGSFLLLAVASSTIVLVCLVTAPSVAALAILRPSRE